MMDAVLCDFDWRKAMKTKADVKKMKGGQNKKSEADIGPQKPSSKVKKLKK